MNEEVSIKQIRSSLTDKFIRYTTSISPKLFRPSSLPYISGDTFRKNAKFIFDETQSFDPADVKKNDTIFLKTDLRELYFKTTHQKINTEYILITHNSDEAIENKDIDFADEKIIKWYAQNLSFLSNDKFFPLPIGFENRRYLKNGRLKNLNLVKNQFSIKRNRILSSFNDETNFILRNNLKTLIETIPSVDEKMFSTPSDYLKNLREYKFVLCPEGNGLDTHRIWEGILTKTIPIVKKSSFSNNFYNLGLPLLLIEDWSDLNGFDENKISKLYENFKDHEYYKYLNYDFWIS